MTAEKAAGEFAKGIVWIASYPKSGNTWTRAFLHNLIKVTSGDDEAAQDINRMGEYSTWEISAEIYKSVINKPPLDVDRKEIAAARPKVQEMIAEQTDGLSFVKTHHALVMDRGYPTINSAVTSGAVYIIRNPLDVAVSFSHHMNNTIDHAIDFMAKVNLETNVSDKTVYEVYGSWSQHVLSWTRKQNRAVFVMRYEDMKADPKAVFGSLARHFLFSPSEEQLDKALALSSFEELQKQEQAAGFKEKPKAAKNFFREGRSGQWREVLSRSQVERIINDHGQQMRRFGYL